MRVIGLDEEKDLEYMCMRVCIYAREKEERGEDEEEEKNDDISKIDIILYLFIYLYTSLLVASEKVIYLKGRKTKSRRTNERASE